MKHDMDSDEITDPAELGNNNTRRQQMEIHKASLQVMGLEERVRKFRTELTETVNACDRFEEGKGDIDHILHEFRDAMYVWQSIVISDAMKAAMARNPWKDHERQSDAKLNLALSDRLELL